ncbi:MAG: tRNA (N6-isopentenyl adenosine(37)-C2)-methylthiotransferase MiaB [Patescibacteria group bacterium]|jgi:tRNA-2-methylthio-N6-dimethylallyladenosine synthase
MKTYHIITIGCQMNKSDSERLAGVLEKQGYKKTDNKYRADLAVVNTCGVRQMAEDRIYGLIPDIKKANKKVKIILTGCLANRKDVRNRLKNYVDVWLPISEITNFQTKAKRGNDYLKIKPKYESKFSAYVPIGNGCDNFCSYCVVPYARGREVYRPVKDILGEVKSLAEKNYKEIVLIAQNVNSYKSGKTDFAGLLKLVNNIKGDFWLRFITSHPKDMSDKLIKAIAGSKKVCRHIHLPAQVGDDKILKMMNRKYSIKHYANLIKKIRRAMPDVSITTDIIVGFPGETEKQFKNSAELMKKIKFDLAYIVRYSPRPGTAAFKLADNVPQAEKKRREEKLTKILKKTAFDNNKKYIDRILKVLVEGGNKAGELFGKTATEKNVKFSMANKKDGLIGKFVNVKITKARDFGLIGAAAE